ncbi:sodium:proton antiporter [Nitrincola alkalilacustris]|uniref:sodium:proton antiporter n=1 Tax=Nitrincola alkalilacustris TaxID=1571224 RepID=UPI00124CCE9A|nr:cation:proton antiporter subunit C [Nitrincola alkalilacustris]
MSSSAVIFSLAGIGLCAIGLFGFMLHTHLIRKLLAFNIMGSGVFLLLVGMAQRSGHTDPVPQALVLTGIVVAVSATALALYLIRRWLQLSGSTELPEDDRR